jgi:3-oxoacyl-[acyl-carrier-protein] synthase II
VPNTPREAPIKVVLSNSFGFGGHNACLLIRKFEG